ncbi:transglycosylase, partial [Campylobacter jejuni]|nr:transglycosylase [Campylobacter jejuni]
MKNYNKVLKTKTENFSNSKNYEE